MSSRKRATPPLGVYGMFEFAEPISTIVGSKILRCTSHRKLEEINKSGIDLYEDIYKTYGITRDIMESDIKVGVVIIGLMDNHGNRYYVPDTFITAYPDQGAVTYNYTILSIDLGPQPSDITLVPLANELRSVASRFTGIAEDLIDIGSNVAVSNTVMSVEEHISTSEARKAAIGTLKPSVVQVVEDTEKIKNLQNTINQLARTITDMSRKNEELLRERDYLLGEVRRLTP